MFTIITIARREIRLGFRNPWSYSFLLTFSIFVVALMLMNSNSQIGIGNYTTLTGTMMNLLLYFLPLMTLAFGSFSITTEKEDGNWSLLQTYPISSFTWLMGKYIGSFIIICAIVLFSFGFAGMIGGVFQADVNISTTLFLLIFSLLLTFIFLAIGIVIGVLSKNRWQALTASVSIWIFFVLAWPILMISTLSSLNYHTLKTALEVVTLVNPAEFIRIFMIIHLGGGHVFGPEYIHWVGWANSSFGTVYFGIFCVVWVSVLFITAIFFTERGMKRG